MFINYLSPFKLNHQSDIFLWGSCFSKHLAGYLKDNQFKVAGNSHGIVFNPVSLFNSIIDCVNCREIQETEIHQNDDISLHFDFHSHFSDLEASNVLNKTSKSILSNHQRLTSSDTPIIFITLGSAWVYERNGEVVANCHKFPADNFSKRLLSVDEITYAFDNLQKTLTQKLNDFRIVFTISPVRHKKDGWIENNQSKGTLHLAIMEILSRFENTHYFPVYEWVIDELRDHRYFEKDGVHPNSSAVEYIIDQFKKAYFEPETVKAIVTLHRIKVSSNHRVQFPGSKNHRHFLITLKQNIQQAEKDYPFLNFQKEQEMVEQSWQQYFGNEA